VNKYLRRGLIGVWVFFAASFLTRWLLTDFVVQTKFPESFWVWLDNIFDVHDVEAQVDLEIFLALGFSLIFVSLLMWVCLFLWRRHIQFKKSF
jgi:hypothetical protein